MSNVINDEEYSNAAEISQDELECLRLTANGMIAQEISAGLGLDGRQVTSLLKSIQAKLKAENRLHAVILAMRQNLI